MARALVVGGGVAGLVAARTLAAEHEVLVVETGTVGGSVRRGRLDGLDIDLGAEGFATRGGVVEALVGELGLTDAITYPTSTGTRIHHPDGSFPLPRGATLGIPTDLTSADLDALGPDGATRAREDANLPADVGSDAPTLGALVRARMGEAVADRWVAPLVAGVHRLDVDTLPPQVLLPGVLDALGAAGSLAAALGGRGGGDGGAAQAPPLAGLTGGMARLVDALESDGLARGVRWQHEEVTAAQVAALGADGLVVLACPPWAWPVTALGARLPAEVARLGRQWPAPHPVDLHTLVLAGDGGGRAQGVVVASGADARARALTYSSAKWPWLAEQARERVVVRLTYDAPCSPSSPGAEIALEQAVADAAALTGADWTTGDVRAWDRTRWAMPRSAVDPAMRTPREAMRAAAARAAGLMLTGGWLAGTGLAFTIADAQRAGATA